MAGFVGCDVTDRPYVLFDFDGTVCDTVQGISSTARRVLIEFGLSEEEIGDVTRLIGPPFPQAFVDVYGTTPEQADRITERYREIYEELGPESYSVYPGMENALKTLEAAGKRLAVASSKREPLLRRMLAGKGLDRYFEVVVGQRDSEHSSKPWVVTETMRQLGCTADQAVMVGDRFYDIVGAEEVDVPCVGVLFGTAPRSELEEAGAAAIVESAEELVSILL